MTDKELEAKLGKPVTAKMWLALVDDVFWIRDGKVWVRTVTIG